ncbi:YbdD/YjiX family protein [Mitsuaria sp. GD03876]|uniref:YbdD/YjiX family protein n=1 Tax=Mitsuaria sp. GD03876 TaxID=2975399 RepID=UPI0024482D49|nr:YbdD/YjiX family protein [Mitsuaria sp. GD03876]MDH0868269.1 YbdD/YjiX family protein [Mitsuaria sp. GD03876]
MLERAAEAAQLALQAGADLLQAGRYMARGVRQQLIGADYGAYLAHMARTHPDQAPLSYEAFFRERQEARYNARTGRCC